MEEFGEKAEGTVTMLHRKEVLKRVMRKLIEEVGLPLNGKRYKGTVVYDQAENLKYDFGVANPEIMARYKQQVDMRIWVTAQEFRSTWLLKFPDKDFVSLIDAQEIIDGMAY